MSKEEGTLKVMVKDRLGKSLELTALSSKQEQLEMVDRQGKTMMMTELAREHEQVDRMDKSWVLTELSSKQEQLELVDRVDKTIGLTELVSEHMQQELENNSTELGNMKNYLNIIPSGSCSRPSGSEDEPEGQQRKQELDMVEMTELAGDPEQLELLERLPKLASEGEQLELEGVNSDLGSCSQPSGSGGESEDHERKQSLEMASNVDKHMDMMSDKVEDLGMLLQSKGSASVPEETLVEMQANEEQGEEMMSTTPGRNEVTVDIKTIVD